jgi:nicotinamidase-related amidase
VIDALLLVDVLNDFRHEDGERLLESFRQRREGMLRAVREAREGAVPVVYAQDNRGVWDGDGRRLVQEAHDRPRGDLLEALAPAEGESLVVKPRYSAFDKTPLELVLSALGTERLLLAGAATEGCVAQTAIDARELGFKVTILADACATVDERNEQVALDYLENVVGARIERLS